MALIDILSDAFAILVLGIAGLFGAWFMVRYGVEGEKGDPGDRPASESDTNSVTDSDSSSNDATASSPVNDESRVSAPTTSPVERGDMESGQTDKAQSGHKVIPPAQKKAVKNGDIHFAAAKDSLEAGAYDEALEALDDAETAYHEAAEHANSDTADSSLDTDQKLEEIEDVRRMVHHQRLDEDLESLDSQLNRAESLRGEGDLEAAKSILEQLEEPLDETRADVTGYGFGDLEELLAVIERRRTRRLETINDLLPRRRIAETIPGPPDIDIEYDELTDKEAIGTGGNADVSRATYPTDDGSVPLAIKRPRMSGTLHTEQVERLLDEAETWDKLDDHDHIVGVVDYGSKPVPWIAMEYMDGGHLGERGGDLDTSQALWTSLAITKAVRHAHLRGVAHLDLKPENVLFRTVNEAWDVPKVADWGLSRHLLEHSKSVEGMSPHYAAPEQFEPEYGPTDNITDVYQLGAVFYELFTGRPPFEGRPTQIMRAVLDQEPDPPSTHADVPNGLDEVLLTALAKEREDRFDDVIYLRDALQNLFDER